MKRIFYFYCYCYNFCFICCPVSHSMEFLLNYIVRIVQYILHKSWLSNRYLFIYSYFLFTLDFIQVFYFLCSCVFVLMDSSFFLRIKILSTKLKPMRKVRISYNHYWLVSEFEWPHFGRWRNHWPYSCRMSSIFQRPMDAMRQMYMLSSSNNLIWFIHIYILD